MSITNSITQSNLLRTFSQEGNECGITGGRLESVSKKIETWINIAFRQGIDISDEIDLLRRLDENSEANNLSAAEETSGLSDLEEKERLATRIVKKVRQDFINPVETQTIERLKNDLEKLTTEVCMPWLRYANANGLDTAEEIRMVYSAAVDGIEILSSGSNHQKEVVYRRHLHIWRMASNQAIEKVYRKQIDDYANAYKNLDRFNAERQSVIEDIRVEALQRLPFSSTSETMFQDCKEVFQIFLKNLVLYNEDPDRYHQLADEEELRRSINQRAYDLLEKMNQNDFYRSKVLEARAKAYQLLQQESYSFDLVRRINDVFNGIENRYENSKKVYRGCAFVS